MRTVQELWAAFWDACVETPRGMFAPFAAFWRTVMHNPVLNHKQRRPHANV